MSSPSSSRSGPAPGTAEERDRNRKLLATLWADFDPLNQTVSEMRQSQAQVQQQLHQQAQQHSKYSSAFDDLKRQVQAADANGGQQELRQLQQQNQQLQQQQTDLRQEMQRMQQQHQQLQQQLQQQQQQQQLLQQHSTSLETLKQQVTAIEGLGKQPAQQFGKNPMLRGGLESAVQELRLHIICIERSLLDSGVLAKKPPGPEKSKLQIEKAPPIGTLSLGEDMFSARMLLKLGYMKVDQRKAIAEGEDSDASDLDFEDGDWSNLVTGINDPVIPIDAGSYAMLSGATLSLCVLVIMVELIAIYEVMQFGIRQGHVCVEHPMDLRSSFSLHLSKALGVIVIGFSLGKRMMDNVTYAMVSFLLNSDGWETKIFALLNLATLLLGAGANCVLFAISTTADGVWLKTTAMVVLQSLRATALTVAKSGILGSTLSRGLNPVSYKLSFYAEYPSWFGHARSLAIGFTSIFILILATGLLLLPMPVCPADGSQAPNIFTDMCGTIMKSVQEGQW